MAIHFKTKDPAALLKAFDARIAQTEPKGKITTWEKISDGKHYTHKAHEWANKAYFKPALEKDQLTFNLIRPQGKDVALTVYAYYHGHLIETFINHFKTMFSEATASPLPESADNCGTPT